MPPRGGQLLDGDSRPPYAAGPSRTVTERRCGVPGAAAIAPPAGRSDRLSLSTTDRLLARLLALFTLRRLPDEAGRTFRYDLPAQMLRGPVLVALTQQGAIWDIVAQRYLHATPFELACIFNATAVGQILSLPIARMTQGRAKMPFVVWPRTLAGAALAAIAFTNTAVWFAVLASVAIALDGTALVSLTAVYERNYPAPFRGRIVAFTRQYQLLLSLVAAAIAARLLEADHEAYRWVYLGLGLLAVASSLVFARIDLADARESRGRLESPSRMIDILRRDKPFRRYMANFMLFGFANLMNGPVVAYFLAQPHIAPKGQPGAEQVAIWIKVVIPGIASVLSVRMWGAIYDRLRVGTVRSLLNLLWACSVAIWLFAESRPPIYVASVLQGVAWGGAQIIWMLSIIPFAPKEEVSVYMGIHGFLTGVRAVVAPQVGAWLYMACAPDGVNTVFGVSLTLMLLSVALTYFFTDEPLTDEERARLTPAAAAAESPQNTG
ncbi:MAG: MFS transporter [Planctomycetes bacterium]|nr:MFS transporter [Planctomycetota bacterium]